MVSNLPPNKKLDSYFGMGFFIKALILTISLIGCRVRISLVVFIGALLGCMQMALAYQGYPLYSAKSPFCTAKTEDNVIVYTEYKYDLSTFDIFGYTLEFGSLIARERQEYICMESRNSASRIVFLSSFNWSAIKSDADMAERILDMARTFKTHDAMADWLRLLGFSEIKLVSNTPNRSYLTAIWNCREAGSRVPFEYNLPFYERWINYGKDYRVQVTYQNSSPISVNAHHISK